MDGPKILLVDIEVLPMEVFTFDLFDPRLSHKHILQDWSIISYAAKYVGKDKIYYQDQRDAKDIRDESAILKSLHELIRDCDIFMGHNAQGFDFPKICTRFEKHKLKPVNVHTHIDTLKIARKHFKISSNSLEYILEFLGCKHRKTSHSKFPGMELFKALRRNDRGVWKELKEYNINDVLATEELYRRIYPWSNKVNFNLYRKDLDTVCHCGNSTFAKWGFRYTGGNKYQRLICTKCGAESRSKISELSLTKKDVLRKHG